MIASNTKPRFICVTRTILFAAVIALSACSLETHHSSSTPWHGTVGGTVSGLIGTGLVLQNNGSDNLPISADGSFTFSTALTAITSYSVSVLSKPNSPSQTCTVTNGSGTVRFPVITSVRVNCVTNTYVVGGTVTGLNGSGLVLQNNAGDNVSIGTNGSFSFNTAIVSGATYSVTVLTQPNSPSQICAVTNGSGGVTNATVTTVQVACLNTYTVSGAALGLRGSGLVLQNNGGDNLTISVNGGFTFTTAIAAGTNYSVTVLTQPGSPSQTCTVTNGSGTVTNANITGVAINCATNTYLFFKGPLSAVDPADPSNPIAIEPAGTTANVTPIEQATYRPAPFYTLVDRHYDTIVYRRTASGTLWKVSVLLGGGLTPAQLSNESGIASICSLQAEPDYADANNAEFVYRLPGADGTCGNADDVWRMVKVGMSATDAPYTALQPLVAIHDRATGAISGWLAINGSNLNAYDENFANPALVSAFSATPSVLATSPDGHIALLVDNALRVYNPQAASLTGSLGTVTSLGNALRDATYVYFDDGAALYKLPLDGSAVASLVQIGAASASLLSLTTDYIVYWDGSSVMSVPKSGGSAVTLTTSGSDSIETIGASGTKYYFHGFHYDPSVPGWRSTAHVIEEDGSNDTTISDAAWFGWTEPTTVSFGSGTRDLALDRILLRSVLTAPYRLVSYVGASGTELATLGTLPDTMNTYYTPFFLRLANNGNVLGYSYAVDSGTQDIVFANTEMNNSLARVTNTSGSNETLVGASGCSISAHPAMDPTLLLILLAAFGWVVQRRRQAKG